MAFPKRLVLFSFPLVSRSQVSPTNFEGGKCPKLTRRTFARIVGFHLGPLQFPPSALLIPFAGLAFVVYWGIVLFGYDVSVPFLTIPCAKRTDVNCAEELGEALSPRTSSCRSMVLKIPTAPPTHRARITSPQSLSRCFRLEHSLARS